MGRLLDLTLLVVLIMMILILQTVGAVMLNPIREEVKNYGVSDKYDATDSANDNYAAITKWAPLTALLGGITLVAYREYRRQKLSAARGLR